MLPKRNTLEMLKEDERKNCYDSNANHNKAGMSL